MIKPIKDLGQNFLRNEYAIEKIVNLLELSNDDVILEIGPGEGVLTKEVLKSEKKFKLIAIDIDPRSIEELKNINDSRFSTILGSYLKENTNSTKILGAIPYNITSPILHKILEAEELPKKVVLVIQKEVADKLTYKKGSYLKNFLNYFYDISFAFKIDKENFFPIPKVDSGVIVMDLKSSIPNFDKKKFSNFLHKIFRSPRKKINKVFSKEFLNECKVDDNKRPEDLTLSEIEILYEKEN
jgi:16S rRNA (adenine1518-N6/adenine1519-N6)-dimethyltransferase